MTIVNLSDWKKPKEPEQPQEAAQKAEMLWRCNCGNTTFFCHFEGVLECGSCRQKQSGEEGQWRIALPEKEPTELMEKGSRQSVCVDEEFAIAQTIKAAGKPTAIAIVSIHQDGSIFCWTKSEEPDNISAGMNDAKEMLLNRINGYLREKG